MNFVNWFLFLANSSSYLLILISSSLLRVLFSFRTGYFFRPSPETPAYPACAFGDPHSFNHLVMIAAIPRKGRDEGIVRSRSCDGPNILRSRILRTTGSRPRSPLRRTIYRSGELTFSCKSSILLLSKVMLGCFTQVRFARPHDEHVLS